jgi:xanthine dehydrogenase YagS FAD-binding subunit
VAEGDNRYHAIFNNKGAAFVSASALGTPLVALGARVKIASASGAREVAVEKFFVIPQSEGQREIALQPNEIVTEILVPPAANVRNATYEVRQKEALDLPLAAASVALEMKGTAVGKASVVLGQVAPAPYRAAAAEKSLAGKTLTPAAAEAAAKAAVAGATPLSRNAYKVQLARVAVKQPFSILANRCENLRWKGMFVDQQDSPSPGDHIYWCLKTQLALGPDGKLVDKYECSPARDCFRAL